MTISVLLPTRNGGRQLQATIESVLSHAGDVELVVSDNDSDEETQAVLAQYTADPRMKLTRQPEMLSVTDNWTETMHAATGDYVLLLGDDDCLMPGAVARLETLLAEHDHPDVLSFEAYGFAFPEALGPGSPAYYSDPLFPIDRDRPRGGELSRAERRRHVLDFFDFEITWCPNLQVTLCKREALLGLREAPFREPYPDFYAINALLLVVDRWVHSAERLSVVGISPKSFGRTLKEGGTDEGRQYLKLDTQFPGWLPGTDMINGSYRFLQRLKDDYGPELQGVEISRSNYVYRQGYDWYLNYRLGAIDRAELVRRIRMLSARDIGGFFRELGKRFSPAMVRRHAKVDEHTAIASVWPGMNEIRGVADNAEFAAWAAREHTASVA